MGIYWRLLGFAKPVEKYAIPYFFYTLFHALFNTFNFIMIIPIVNTLFDKSAMVEQVTEMPHFALNMDYFNAMVNYLLFTVYGGQYDVMNLLVLLALFISFSAFLSNLFRYLGQRTIENMKINTLRRLRNAVFDNVMGLNVGYFSNERKGDIMSKITSDVQVVQFCITNTLQVAFREPFLIIGYMFAMVKLSWELTIFSAIYLPIVALVGSNNLSTAVIILGIAVILIFVTNPRYLPFVGVAGAGTVLVAVFLSLESYRLERLAIWRNPEAYEKGFQTIQGLYAIGSGGIFGKGIGSSLQKLGFVPEAQNDMIFSIICEETGLVGACLVILAFGLLIWRLMVTAVHAPDLAGTLIASGIMGHIAIQVILNIAVVTNTIPNTGITLPFISYGGTSVAFLLAEMGLALSVTRMRR